MFQLKRFLRPYLKQTIIGSVAKLVEAILELLLPLLMARIIDVGIHNMDIPYIWKTGILMLGVIIVGLGSATLCQYFASVTCQNVGNDIRRELIQKISQLSYQELDQFGNATLINRLTNDVNQVVMAVAYLIRLVSRAPFLCVGALVMSIYIDPQLSLVFVVLIPIFVLVLVVIMKKTVPLYQNAQRKLDRLGQVLRENLSGVRVIRAFARHEKERERMDEATEQLARANIHVTNLSALMNPITSVVMNAGIIVLLYFGGISVNAGNLTQGSIVALINYVTQILMALIIVANLVVLFTKASASANRINEVLTCDVSVKDQQAERELDPTAPFVEFDHVSFGYNQKEVLEDISFTLPVGNILGVVGTTGSGKSTLINLIPRFYDVNQGEVRFGGKPVKQLAQDYLRSKITIVPQKTVLFSGSIADNIRWGKEDATEQEIIEALKAAQAYDFVKTLNKGIHSQIHEGGKNFSGGQQQRLSIARALVRKPDLLILDDSLSALDYQTDLKLRRSLREYLKNGTIIIVSQRISSVTLADHILVLDDGKLVGHGKHEELLQTCETYQEIYQSQSK
ncbi:ABC transporter ATP-binding protein [Clostridium facile]|uniref:ABC transporter ATP-binding protein n=1 Tax=Clostridium facile TaxID=2763035 RepID=A0ABR7ISC6_9CLOT|nr:ABC transporter ATP-binding protein [Clostridium facile]MBC5788050.1 ABC transporter ATP-binding protein [Clostridium facile]